MQTLWAPWRMAYIGEPKTPGCIFCRARDADDPRQHHVLTREPALVMLNKYPYASGHIMVAPRQHTADLSELSPADFHTLMTTLHHAAQQVQAAFAPEGMNIGMNLGVAGGAGVTDHMHWHIVPRWNGDTNFMPMLADVRVMPEHLETTYDRLLPLFSTR